MGSRQDGPRGADETPADRTHPEAGDVPVEPLVADVPGEPPAGDASIELEFVARDEAVKAAWQVEDRVRAGLFRWLALLVGGIGAGAFAGRGDLAPFLCFAALFALFSAWDARERALTGEPAADAVLKPRDLGSLLRLFVPPLVPLIGAVFYAWLASYAQGLPRAPERAMAIAWCAGASLACLALALPPVSRFASRLITRSSAGSHVARLTAALAVFVLLLPVPLRLLINDLTELFPEGGEPLVDAGGLVTQLIGELAIALAAVGLWLSRDARATWDRLGLHLMRLRHWGIAVLGLAAVTGVNGGLEWVERTWLPDLWRLDQAMSEQIVGNLGLPTLLLLGLSAGVGEEVLVRGALQPRSGILWASLIFGAAHVQYTWFGILVIVLLGVTLGLIRRFANTTTAIVVHGLYDVLAAFGTGP
jgi:hypothetical protein